MNMYGDDTFIQVFVLLILLPLKIKQKKFTKKPDGNVSNLVRLILSRI